METNLRELLEEAISDYGRDLLPDCTENQFSQWMNQLRNEFLLGVVQNTDDIRP